MSRRRKKFDFNFWEDTILPPCANFLGNYNPLIKHGRELYRNYNRLFMFLTFTNKPAAIPTYNTCDPKTFVNSTSGNIQISIHDFFICLYINLLQKGNISNEDCCKIHENDECDEFIKSALEVNEENITYEFIPELTYVISNSNAIVPLYSANFTISKINFYIILMLNRLEGDPGLLWGNNAYATPDYINFELSNLFTTP